MVKILIGLITAVIVAIGGYFGFELYTQHRIAGEIDTALEQIRAAGGKASHGKVSFDLWSRTAVVDDFATESAAKPPVSVKIAKLTISGAAQPTPDRFSADNIEATDIEVGVSALSPANWQVSYKAPRIAIKNYAGPARLQAPPASASALEAYRFILERFATASASSIEAPSIAGALNLAPAMAATFTYSNIALREIKDGKIAIMQTDRVGFTVNMQQAGKPAKMTGEMTNLVARDYDIAAAAAILDPQKANDDRYYRFYGETTVGPCTISSDQGLQMRIEGMTIDDVAVRPARLQLAALIAAFPAAGAAPPTPEQARALLDKMANAYQAVRIGKNEMRGLSITTPQGPFKLASMRMNLEDGKIGEFALEGLDARSPKGPLAIGRFALKSFDLAGLLRVSAQFSNPAQRPAPDQLLGLLALLQGIEVKSVVVPFMDTGKTVNLDHFDLNWGQFVGPIPSQARLTAKMTTPVDAKNPSMMPLVAAGIDSITADTDLGAAWTEASGAFVLDPVKFDIAGMLEASARVSLGHVQRQLFNPQQTGAMLAQVEAGAIELTLRDTGGVDLSVKQYARAQNVSADEARQAIIDSIRTQTANAASPEATAVGDALASFVETPKSTLTLKLTPRGSVPLMLLIQQLKADPAGALAQFAVEASAHQ
jgi:hypothetical protein